MKLTMKGRYAVTALLDVALHQKEGPTTITEVACRQRISLAYLERLAGVMRAKGLLKSVRGAKGGYLLARAASEISIADIIQAVEGRLDATRCRGKENCQEGGRCLTHDLWEQLNQKVYRFLEEVTLHALVETQRAKQQTKLILHRGGAPCLL